MKKDLVSANDVKMSELRDYILQFNVNEEEIMECWSMKSLLKKAFYIKDLYAQALNALQASKNYEEMERNLIMMNKLFHHKDYENVKKDLLDKLMCRNVSLTQYCVIRHLVKFKKYDFEILMNRLYASHLSTPIEIAKMCLLEDHYDLAYSYLKILDCCDNDVILDLIYQHSIPMYYQLKHFYNKKRSRLLSLQMQ